MPKNLSSCNPWAPIGSAWNRAIFRSTCQMTRRRGRGLNYNYKGQPALHRCVPGFPDVPWPRTRIYADTHKMYTMRGV
ncbi:hypothetical protein BD309DRAFT_975109 [Dichomitus squalens]|nr:hypothetical protein BD309DRAFT_975109 [Dichomitus squalens]